MPIRITGMNSGLDTESIITELVKAQKTKTENIKKKQTSLQWKQDAWKELNSKIYKLFQNTLGNMRFSTDYSKKVTDVSNNSAVKVLTGSDAMNITQKLHVTHMAENGYLTGGQLDKSITKESKLTEALNVQEGSRVSLTVGDKTTDIAIDKNMTVNGFLQKLQEAGVEANYDVKNSRFHIAAKASGTEADFTLTGANAEGTDALSKLGILSYDANTVKEYEKYANMSAADKDALIAKETERRLQGYISQKDSLVKTQEEQQKAVDDSKEAFLKEYNESIDAAVADKANLKTAIDDLRQKIKDAGDNASEDDKAELTKLEGKMTAVEQYEQKNEQLSATQQSIASVDKFLKTENGNVVASDDLKDEVTAQTEEKIREAQKIVSGSRAAETAENKTIGKSAEITLNGVTYTSESNTFEVNGLTITVMAETNDDITLTTRQDTDGIYDKIKSFFKEYNALINEMDKLYNAEATKGYDPLTDEEKDSMTDTEIEKWEEKIKGSILRRDSNLSTISSAMKTIMMQGAMVNGKQMYLADFGIETGGWFTSAENEKNAYHINGDEDDSTVSAKENQLRAAIAADPDTVIAFFSELSNNLYKELDNQSRSMEGIRSFGSFYDDKKMKEDYDNYKTKIAKAEEQLTAMEDRWYKKFSAMETALAKMQSNQSAVSALLGG